jgi:hypothetical protein
MLDFRQGLINSTLNRILKRLHYPLQSSQNLSWVRVSRGFLIPAI